MRRILLIRHAMPLVDVATAPGDWPLSDEGRRRSLALRDRLPEGMVLFSSAERKAIETLRLASGREATVDARFGEVRRPVEPVDADVRPRRRAWVESRFDERHRGWETPVGAAARFDEAVRAHDGDLAIATHGMILTAWLVSRGLLAPGADAGSFWEGLGIPDVVHVTI